MALRRVRFRAIAAMSHRAETSPFDGGVVTVTRRIFFTSIRARPLVAIPVSVSVSGGAEKMERGRGARTAIEGRGAQGWRRVASTKSGE